MENYHCDSQIGSIKIASKSTKFSFLFLFYSIFLFLCPLDSPFFSGLFSLPTSNHRLTLFAYTLCLFTPHSPTHPDIRLPASFPTWRLMHCEPCARLLLSRHTGCGDFNQLVKTENVSANKVSGLPRGKMYYHSLSQLKEGI